MASEIRVNKINSRTGVGTITLSPTGVDFTGIATVATLKATTGNVTTLTSNTGIVTTLTVDTTRTTTGIVTTLTADTSRITTGIVTTLTADTAKVGAAVTISESGMEVTGVTTVTSSINIGTGTSITSSSLIVNDVQYPTAGALGNRNLIINGGMTVAQRGTSVTGIGVDDYTCCDRFKNFAALSGQAGRLTATQENITDLAGFNKALKLQVTTAETPGSTESYGLNTRFELQDVKGLDIGTSAAVPLTLSFYAKAPTGNGVFCAGIMMPGGGTYIEEVTIGTSWSRHEINIPATTNSAHASTQTNDTHNALEVQITLMAGSSRNGHAGNTWETGTDNRATSNQTNFFSSTSNNLFITGVQLERGEKATPFEHRSYSDELARCQRYFYKITGNTTDQTSLGIAYCYAATNGDEHVRLTVHFPTTMRADIAYSSNNLKGLINSSNEIQSNSSSGLDESIYSTGIDVGFTSSSLSVYDAIQIRLNNSADAYVQFSAEL